MPPPLLPTSLPGAPPGKGQALPIKSPNPGKNSPIPSLPQKAVRASHAPLGAEEIFPPEGGPRNGGGVTNPVRVPTHSKVGGSGGPNCNKDILRRPKADLLIPPSSVPHSSSGSKDKPCPNGENSTHAARMARQGVRQGNSGTNSFVLFKDVYGTQTRKRDVQAHHRPLGSKFFSGGPSPPTSVS